MGLWEYCFDQFRYPYFQYDKLFDGCHHVFSHEYYVIREWLLPPWLMAVQAFVTMSFLLSFGAQVIMAMQLCRFPLEFVLQYEWILSSIDFVCTTTTSKYKDIFYKQFYYSINSGMQIGVNYNIDCHNKKFRKVYDKYEYNNLQTIVH